MHELSKQASSKQASSKQASSKQASSRQALLKKLIIELMKQEITPHINDLPFDHKEAKENFFLYIEQLGIDDRNETLDIDFIAKEMKHIYELAKRIISTNSICKLFVELDKENLEKNSKDYESLKKEIENMPIENPIISKIKNGTINNLNYRFKLTTSDKEVVELKLVNKYQLKEIKKQNQKAMQYFIESKQRKGLIKMRKGQENLQIFNRKKNATERFRYDSTQNKNNNNLNKALNK